MKMNRWTSPRNIKNHFVITSIFAFAIAQLITPVAHAALSGWTVTSSTSNFTSNPPTWDITVSTSDSASALTVGDTATFLIEDQLGESLGSAEVEIMSDTTQVSFNVELDPALASSDLSDTDFVGTFMVSHPVDDDEIFDMPLTRQAQSLGWDITSNNLSTATKPYVWTLKFSGANSDSFLNSGDTAELFISDVDSNALADETITVTKNNVSTLNFKISIDPATMTSGWSADTLDGMLVIETTSGDQQVLELPIPISGLPNRPAGAGGYIKKSSDYSDTPYIFQPTSCVDVKLSTVVNDPYHDLSNILYALNDGSGNSITQGVAEATGSTYAAALYVCPDDIKNLVSPFTLVLGLTFEAPDREYIEVSNPFTWEYFVKAAPKAVATAKPKPVKITCVRAKPYSKITTTKAKCPAGYKKKL